MAHIALFHGILGVRPGELDAARRFTEAGHEVRVIDQYEGEVFDESGIPHVRMSLVLE